jgi:hypothetical protein
MTQDEIIEMARQAGFHEYSFESQTEQFNRFAKLVAEREREACSELVWPKLKIWSEKEQTAMRMAFNQAQENLGRYETLMAVGASVLKIKAEAIRARGQA